MDLSSIDHVAQTMQFEEFLSWLLYYTTLFDMTKTPQLEIADPMGIVYSQAVESPGRGVRFTLTGWGVLISLLEAVVDRAADHLERAGQIVDETSKKTFGAKRTLAGVHKQNPRKGVNLQELIERIGEEGDFVSKMRESLVSIGRAVAFMQAVEDQARENKQVKENKARIKILQRDIVSLTDHATFLSGKISFLLDAVLGLISIEQNGIIKIFSVAAVVFLPPTLVASIYGMNFAFMPELQWQLGYPFAILLMIMSAVLPYYYFKGKGWL